MSNAKAAADREPFDSYYTPDALAADLVSVLPLYPAESGARFGSRWTGEPPTVIEPSIGGGAFARALIAKGCRVTGIDLNPDATGLCLPGLHMSHAGADFGTWPADRASWVVGNPPFSLWREHVDRARSLAPNVAFLLRFGLFGNKKDHAWWTANMPEHVYPISPRPSFTANGKSDSAPYVFLVWGERYRQAPCIFHPPILWR